MILITIPNINLPEIDIPDIRDLEAACTIISFIRDPLVEQITGMTMRNSYLREAEKMAERLKCPEAINILKTEIEFYNR